MPVLKVYKNGNWEELGGTSPMDGGNADTLDGYHAEDFAQTSAVSDLQTKVGDTPVADQINNALSNFIMRDEFNELIYDFGLNTKTYIDETILGGEW